VRNFNIPFHFVFNFFFGVFVFGFDACLWVIFGVGFEHSRVWFRTGFDIGGMRFTLELKLGFVFLSDSRLTSASLLCRIQAQIRVCVPVGFLLYL